MAPLDEKGETVERKGFHVECTTDLDCFSRCGSHPVTGTHYVCTHNLKLYSHAGLSKKAYNDLKAESADLAAKGEAHIKVWLPETHNEEFYLMEEPGTTRTRTETPRAAAWVRTPTTPPCLVVALCRRRQV